MSQIEFGHGGGAELVHERRAAQRGDDVVGEPQDAGGVGGELRATAAVPAHVRRLQVDEVGRDDQGLVERLAVEHPARLGLERQHRVPRVELAEPGEPVATVRGEQVGEHRVVRAVTALPAASSACSGENSRPIASMSWLTWTIRIGSGIASPPHAWGSPCRSSART